MVDETKFWMLEAAPTPVGPFSHAVETDGWVFVTGQMPTDPDAASAYIPPSFFCSSWVR